MSKLGNKTFSKISSLHLIKSSWFQSCKIFYLMSKISRVSVLFIEIIKNVDDKIEKIVKIIFLVCKSNGFVREWKKNNHDAKKKKKKVNFLSKLFNKIKMPWNVIAKLDRFLKRKLTREACLIIVHLGLNKFNRNILKIKSKIL